MSRRFGTVALAVAAFVLAALLALLATDVRRWEEAVREGDARFVASPGTESLWQADTVLPRGVTRRLLGLDGDLDYRAGVRMFRLGRTREPAFGRERLPAYRAHAETELTAIARGDGDRARRSRALNLLGVLMLARARTDPPRSAGILRDSVATFRAAIEVDPRNTDAQANLELLLRLRTEKQRQRQERERSGPRGEARRGGLARAGSGY